MNAKVAGGCACGAVRYKVNDAIGPAYACHCLACKKQSASAFSMAIFCHIDALSVSGSTKHFVSISDSGKVKYCYFCEDCGTRMWNSDSLPARQITLKVGTLDQPESIAAEGHLWLSRKQPGFDIPLSIPQHKTQPDDLNRWRTNLRKYDAN